MKYSVLIVDDDYLICNLLNKLFCSNGYLSICANNVQEAQYLVRNIIFQLIVLDYRMPDYNGLEFVDFLHNENLTIPVIMLTANMDIDDKLTALSKGLNDYLTKPFNSQELLLRAKNLINVYYNTQSQQEIAIGNLNFNFHLNHLHINDNFVYLSSVEAIFLNGFFENINTIVTKEFLLNLINKQCNDNNLNSLNVNIMRLRKKLTGSMVVIRSIRGKGYMLTYE